MLIHAAAGGVGHLAVQLAKWKGARVIGTASARNQSFVEELGADEVIDYTTTAFESVAREVDVVLDAVGDEVRERSWQVLKPGILVALVGTLSAAKVPQGVRGVRYLVRPSGVQLAEVAGLIDAGHVRPFVEHILPLSEAAKAHAISEQGHTRGKIVLQALVF